MIDFREHRGSADIKFYVGMVIAYAQHMYDAKT